MSDLGDRTKYLGGSDAAAVLGIDPWTPPLTLWARKVGHLPVSPEQNEAMLWGTLLEGVVAEEWARREGKSLGPSEEYAHKDFAFIRAHVDRTVNGEKAGLEVKTARTDQGWGPSGSGIVPEHYVVQCQHYMALTGWDQMYLACLIGGQELRSYVIPRSEKIIERLIDAEVEFWTKYVIPKKQPPPTWDHPRIAEAVKEVQRFTQGTVIALGEDALHWHRVYQESQTLSKRYSQAADIAKAHLLHLMGDAETGVIPGEGRYVRKIIRRKGYTVPDSEYERFIWKEDK